MVKVMIDRELCDACGSCNSTCPPVFELDEEGKALIADDFKVEGGDPKLSVGEIPDDLLDCARTAQDGCSPEAISVEE